MRIDPFELLLASHFPILDSPDDLPHVPGLLQDAGPSGQPSEFCASLRTDPEMVGKAAASGYIPMGLEVGSRSALLVKLNTQRCILEFPHLHVGKSTRRRARGLHIVTDRDAARCLEAIVDYHPERWLIEPLCRSLLSLHQKPRYGVAVRSVEIYRGERLVAGEIGYTCGAVYTSLSGFHRESGAGSVQLACLGRALADRGFAFWDLGMEVDYKLRLGAHLVSRDQFLTRFRRRSETPELRLDHDCAAIVGQR